MLRLVLILSLFFAPLANAKKVDANEPQWEEFVAGSVNDLPDGAIKAFLVASHFDNPYAARNLDKTKLLGPFSPEANNVFWIPTIDMPMSGEEWRFLSSMQNLPESVLHNAVYEKGGQQFVRMFLHPLTTEVPAFKALAKKFGGFKYEYQGGTSASIRSLVAWKPDLPRSEFSGISLPKDPNKFIWPKVSVFNTNIGGSRLNPLKKMVRANQVTELMDAIPKAVRDEQGFNFSGEHVVGVPDGTDAGFVLREVLPEYVQEGGGHVKPGFSMFSPKHLDEITSGVKDVDKYVNANFFEPLAKTISYLLMEEGMIGEYHAQNQSWPVDAEGKPQKKVLLHDADAFRTSVIMRAANGKELTPFKKIETPFFFVKDSMFRLKDNPNSELMGLDSMLYDFATQAKQAGWTATGSVYDWCKDKKPVLKWCTVEKIEQMFREALAKEMTPYVGRKVLETELDYRPGEKGNNGLVNLFEERMQFVSARSPALTKAPDPNLQILLSEEYGRLNSIGLGGGVGKSIVPGSVDYVLVENGNSSYIAAVSRGTKTKPRQILGIGLVGSPTDAGAKAFAAEMLKKGVVVPQVAAMRPILQDIGGGNNRERAPPANCQEKFRKIYVESSLLR